jgi:hypothetical protein
MLPTNSEGARGEGFFPAEDSSLQVPAALLVLVLHVLTKSARVGSSRIVIESEGF